MNKNNQYKPETISHPGKTLKAKIEEMDLSVSEFSLRADLPEASVMAVINGDSPITSEMAASFEDVTNIPVHFWVSRQRIYDEFKATPIYSSSLNAHKRTNDRPATRSRIQSFSNSIARQ